MGSETKMAGQGGSRELTQRDVVVWLHGHVLPYLDLVDGLENGEAVANAGDAQVLEVGMLQCCQCIARDALLCGQAGLAQDQSGRGMRCHVPTKVSAYCSRPRSAMKSAAWSTDHSIRCPVGLLLLSLEWVKVVGVCSVLSGPELVGELSYSAGRVGLWMPWRSNSSSASESSWYFVV